MTMTSTYVNGANVTKIDIVPDRAGEFNLFVYTNNQSLGYCYHFPTEEAVSAVMTNLFKGLWARVK